MAQLCPTFETKIFAKITSSVETVKFPVRNMKVNNVHTTKLTLNIPNPPAGQVRAKK